MNLFKLFARKLFQQPAKDRRFQPSFEALENRVVPSVTAAVRTIREATAGGPESNAQAGILATVTTFQADLGGVNNGNTVGSQGTGRRQITWDGADNDSAPARLPADFFNAIAPRGAIFGGDPRIQFQQSADATPAVAGTPVEFGNINATYPTAFATFSTPRLFTSLTHNVFEVEFYVPGTLERATVSGFGAVFTDVDVAGSTKIEFFDINGQEILERNVLATAGDESLSFLGVSFIGAPLAKVRITAGNAILGANDITQSGTNDMVVMDDFIYGEPQVLKDPLVVVGSGNGGQLVVFNSATEAGSTFTPFAGYTGEIRVAVGDVNGDGRDDIIAATGPGVSPSVKVFDGTNLAELHSFFAFAPGFTSGISVAAANVNGDRFIDIIVGANGAPGGHVKVIDGANASTVLGDGEISGAALLASFYAFSAVFTGGVNVAAADVNGDFRDDVVVGVLSGLVPPTVVVVDATQLTNKQSDGQIAPAALIFSFLAFQPGFLGGLSVAGGDVNGDGRADIIVGAGPGAGPHVKAFDGSNAAELRSFFAYDPNFAGGVLVGTGSFSDDDLRADIVTGQGKGGGLLRFIGARFPFDPLDLEPFSVGFTGGIFVAGSRF